MEAIQTVSVASNSFDADQSTGGGAISVTIKSGTNTLHGSLFEDHADRSLEGAWLAIARNRNCRSSITNSAAPSRTNQEDKLFYFVSYEGCAWYKAAVAAQVLRRNEGGNLSASPTPIYDPMTSGRQRQNPIRGQHHPRVADRSRHRASIASSWPDPNQPGSGAFGLSQNFLCRGARATAA